MMAHSGKASKNFHKYKRHPSTTGTKYNSNNQVIIIPAGIIHTSSRVQSFINYQPEIKTLVTMNVPVIGNGDVFQIVFVLLLQ
jgi:hypothetical protein